MHGKQYLAFPSTPSIGEIRDLQEVEPTTSSSDEDDEEVLKYQNALSHISTCMA